MIVRIAIYSQDGSQLAELEPVTPLDWHIDDNIDSAVLWVSGYRYEIVGGMRVLITIER